MRFISAIFCTSSLFILGCGSDASNTPPPGVTQAPASESPADFSESPIQVSHRLFDLAIRGQGFFIVESDRGYQYYTRSGHLRKSSDGVLHSEGFHLKAYPLLSDGRVSTDLSSVNLSVVRSHSLPTSRMQIRMNLNASAPIQNSEIDTSSIEAAHNTSQFHSAIITYDIFGHQYLGGIYFRKIANNRWAYAILGQIPQTGELAFDNHGHLISPLDTNAPVVVDFSHSTQYGNDFSVYEISQDGRGQGELVSIDITSSGRIEGHFSNGASESLYQIPLAKFSKQEKLIRVSGKNHIYASSPQSGQAEINFPKIDGRGWINPYALEEKYRPEIALPDFSQGSLEFSPRVTDLAIVGQGFFMVENPETQERHYTRKGNFGQTSCRHLALTDSEFLLLGHEMREDGIISMAMAPILIPHESAPVATNEVILSLNLDASEPTLQTPFNGTSFVKAYQTSNYSIGLDLYDSLGNHRPAELYFRKIEANRWTYHLLISSENLENGQGSENETVILNEGRLQFDTNGQLLISMTTLTRPIVWNGGAASVSQLAIVFDRSEFLVTQYDASESEVKSISQNGRKFGWIESLGIDSNGFLMAHYSSGHNKIIAAIPLATFPNEEGLSELVDRPHYYVENAESGSAQIGLAATGGRGALYDYALESKYK